MVKSVSSCMQDDLIRRALVALLDSRDFLGYQLTHANGGMSDQDLNEIAEDFFSKHEAWDEADIRAVSKELARLIPDRLDFVLLATVTNCGISLASRIIVEGAEAEVQEEFARDPSLARYAKSTEDAP